MRSRRARRAAPRRSIKDYSRTDFLRGPRGGGRRGGTRGLKSDLSCFSGSNSHFPLSGARLLVPFRFRVPPRPFPPHPFPYRPFARQSLRICKPRQRANYRARDIRLHHRVILPPSLLFSRPRLREPAAAKRSFNGLRSDARVPPKRQRGRKVREHATNEIGRARTALRSQSSWFYTAEKIFRVIVPLVRVSSLFVLYPFPL